MEKLKPILEVKLINEARSAGWRVVDPSKECFLIPPSPPNLIYPEIELGIFSSLLEIFLHFFDQHMVTMLMDSLTLEDVTLGYRNKACGTTRRMTVTPQLVYKVFAVHIRIIGMQFPSHEVIRKPLRAALDECREHFRDKHCPSIDYLERMTSVLLFEDTLGETLSSSFQSVVSRLGHSVAGDERLFHFSGKQGSTRLVKCKPGQVGLWLHELCCKLSCGVPFLLHFRLHRNISPDNDYVRPSEVVRRWVHMIKSIGNGESNQSRNSLLAFDNYYLDTSIINFLREESRSWSIAVQAVEICPERELLMNGTVDMAGEYRAIYNDCTKELFSYHCGSRKSNDEKYTYSLGLVRSEDLRKIRETPEAILDFDVHESLMEACNNFNDGLNHKSWPHRRGGGRRTGHFGLVHDFIFASILQNTFNLHSEMGGDNERNATFHDKCLELSEGLFEYADTL